MDSIKSSRISVKALLEDLGHLVRTYAECRDATPPVPPKPTGSQRIDKISSDIFYLAMRTFVAESRAASLLHDRSDPWSPALQSPTFTDGHTAKSQKPNTEKRALRVDIPPNNLSSVFVPVSALRQERQPQNH